MKDKGWDKLLIFAGCLCMVSALAIWGYYKYTDYRIVKAIEENVKASNFAIELSADEPELVTEAVQSSDEDVDIVLEGYHGDQEVEEVVTYKNVLEIPKIEVTVRIFDGVSAYSLSRGIGRHTETKKVGEVGNCVVAGHASQTYRCIFNRLEEMQMLDEFYAYDASGVKHRYYVIKRFVCQPSYLSILEDTDDGRSTMTIYTCTNGGTMRFVLVGTEFTDEELAEFRDTYEYNKVSTMRGINDSLAVEPVSMLLGFRSSAPDDAYKQVLETYGVAEQSELYRVHLREGNLLKFGIILRQEEESYDVVQD